MSVSESLYSALIRRDSSSGDGSASSPAEGLPEDVARDVPRNGMRLVSASALQSSGDQTMNPSTVLPWVFHVLGVPTALVGLLVPIRESLSMLPQALLTPMILRVRRRKWVFVTGAAVQAAGVATITAIAALGSGTTAGIGILVALAVFALGRCLCSISSKDVQGRTLPKGERGQIIGLATSVAGLVAVTLGVALRLLGGEDLGRGALTLLLGGGALLWVAAATVYATVREPADDPAEQGRSARDGGEGDRSTPGDDDDEPTSGAPGSGSTRIGSSGSAWFAEVVDLFREDRTFRRFVTVRGLALVSALSPPFLVSLSVASGTGALAGLGGFVLASGVAALIGGRVFGRLADRSSRLLLAGTAGAASVIVLVVVGLISLPGFDGGSALGAAVFVGGYFLLALVHTGVRVARQTYVVDVADGDLRTTYVSVANSTMGVLLLVVGGISTLVAMIGTVWALGLLAALGLVGAVLCLGMPEVSAGAR